MSDVEVSQSKDLIQGNCDIVGNSFTVLYDSDATHSFISLDCVKQLKLSVHSLSFG